MTTRTLDVEFKFSDHPKTHIAYGLICDSLSDLADLIADKGSAWPHVHTGVRQTLRTGDESNVPKSDKLLDKFEALEMSAASQYASERCVAGGFPDVPAYLSGSPVAMRRRVKRESLAPLTIVCDVGTSAAISGAVIERRGVAVLALVRKLIMAGYPVNLYLGIACKEGSADKSSMVAVKVDTAPLDLARACWALSNESYQREVMFQTVAGVAGKRNNASTLWPFGGGEAWIGRHKRQSEAYAAFLGVDPAGLLVVPPVFATEAEHFKTDESTLAWVRDQYAKTVAQARGE